ncbi:MAG: flagellar protein FlgN [Leptospiraceae bacterium]|nr:flagellar protein FlgN [Leptospiraceae bacterium]MCP5499972.1 flagellar protein FlgN [Leptospiraceae bacterium]
MKKLSAEWLDDLVGIFKEEIRIYRDLLDIELKKKDTILKAEGKKLQEFTNQTRELISKAARLEENRMKSIQQVYEDASIEKKAEIPVLSEFLDQIDRDSNYKLKGLANDLKEVVRNLKEKLEINERLLKSRHDMYEMTMDVLKQATEVEMPSYDSGSPRGQKSRAASVLLNTRA